MLSTLAVQPSLIQRIITAQQSDEVLQQRRQKFVLGEPEDRDPSYSVDAESGLRFRGRLCVPSDLGLRAEILDEAHKARYTVHPGSTKMYMDLKRTYWWDGMKRDVAEYVSRCLTCQLVKAQHQRPGGLL